jgi:hypothetical protein
VYNPESSQDCAEQQYDQSEGRNKDSMTHRSRRTPESGKRTAEQKS